MHSKCCLVLTDTPEEMVVGEDENMEGNCSLQCEESVVDLWAKLVLEEISIPVVGIIGFVGNIVTILILKKPVVKSTFHQSLITLSVLNILFLSFIICDHSMDLTSQVYVYMFPYFLNPGKNILMSWETFLIMSIAAERFLAVYKPIYYRSHKSRRSSRFHLIIFILPSMLLSIILNIPKFFETELVRTIGTDENNKTHSLVDFEITSLRVNPDYIYYYVHWTRLLFTGVIPFVFLSIINLLIYVNIKKERPFYSRPSKQSLLSNERKLSNLSLPELRKCSLKHIPGIYFKPKPNRTTNANNSSGTLIAIILMYMICNIPRLVLNLTEYLLYSSLYGKDMNGCSLTPIWFAIICRVSHLLLAVNSSLNFLLYISLGSTFKNIFHQHGEKIMQGRLNEETNHLSVNLLSQAEDENLLLIFSRKYMNHRTSVSLNQIEHVSSMKRFDKRSLSIE